MIGSGSSDPDGQALTYRWTAADANPAPVVLSPRALIPFVLSVPGEYVYLLTVEAGARSSEADSVSAAPAIRPVAHAGIDAIYRLDAVIFLDAASSTDADGALPSPPCGSLYPAQDGRRFPWGDDEPGLLLSIDPPSSCSTTPITSRGRRWSITPPPILPQISTEVL